MSAETGADKFIGAEGHNNVAPQLYKCPISGSFSLTALGPVLQNKLIQQQQLFVISKTAYQGLMRL